MSASPALRPPKALRYSAHGFLVFWCLIAAFPIFWIAVMSLKAPIDAFSSNPFAVIFGFETRRIGTGLSAFDLAVLGLAVWGTWRLATWAPHRLSAYLIPVTGILAGRMIGWAIFTCGLVAVALLILPPALSSIDSHLGLLGVPLIGVTGEHYFSVWVESEFYRNFLNSAMVTAGVVAISLSAGTLAGFGLARRRSAIAFWILIAALIFRALPHSVLVAGYLPTFIGSADILRPFLGDAAPTLYGKPLPVIFVLVAINQPFTIWMLRSFFANIPNELDEAARVDGCTYFQAFRLVIVPVMWPGVITAGLFSFLLGYNDYLVTSLLLDAQNQTMVPGIASFFNRETTSTDQVRAVAAAVSITAPLFVLVMVFQRQIVSGLTAGAVKG